MIIGHIRRYSLAVIVLAIFLSSTYAITIKNDGEEKSTPCCIGPALEAGSVDKVDSDSSLMTSSVNAAGRVGEFVAKGIEEISLIWDYIKSDRKDYYKIKMPGNLFLGISFLIISVIAYNFTGRVLREDIKYVIKFIFRFIVAAILPSRKTLFRIWLRPARASQSTGVSTPKDLLPGLVQPKDLLPGQLQVVRKFKDLVDGLSHDRPGRMVGMTAEWGGGKSFVSNYLFQHGFRDGGDAIQNSKVRKNIATNHSDGTDNVVVVQINAWGAQTDHDLHLSMMKAVLGDRAFFDICAQHYPMRLLFAPLLSGLGLFVPRGVEIALGATKATVGSGSPLPMFWQEEFASIVKNAVENYRLRLVVIIDEIDRCEPVLAQAAMTMARRALDMPGVLTIVPFVEEKMDYSVFNPVQVVLPDLRASIYSVLADEFTYRPIFVAPLSLTGPPLNAAKEGAEGKADEGVDGKGQMGNVDRRLAYEARYAQERYLLEEYWEQAMDPVWKVNVHQKFKEKYLAEIYRLSALDGDGIGKFITECRTPFLYDIQSIIQAIDRLLYGDKKDGFGVNGVIQEIMNDVIKNGVKIKIKINLKSVERNGRGDEEEMDILGPGIINSIRSFQGALSPMLAIFRHNRHFITPGDPAGREARGDDKLVALQLLTALITMVIAAAAFASDRKSI